MSGPAQRPSLVPYGDLSHAGLLLAAEESRMRAEGYRDDAIRAWLAEDRRLRPLPPGRP